MLSRMGAGLSMPAFAERLKDLRERASLTQEALAKRAGLSRGAIAQLETGVREPTWATVQAIARGLGVSVQAFDDYQGEPAEQPPQDQGE